MLFNSLDFILFLPTVIILYYALPARFRWILLLLASYFFYMSWKVDYIFLIIGSTLVDYFCGLQMEKAPDKKKRKPYLILSLLTNLGLLFSFKYFNFFTNSIGSLIAIFGSEIEMPFLDLLLPVGISFYTFQTLSYSIDVYLGKQKAEKHLGYFALYVSYFPQLVAGPIERFSRLSPQLKEHHTFSFENLRNGLRLILYGLFIKMVIADNISPLIDQVYKAPELFNSIDILKAILLYSFQIYSDFYGYSIIAIGSALIMGVKIMDNFNTPYLSINIAEFWQRWHISLSTWFRDYLYYPLGGNRVSKKVWVANISIVFIVSGIWHGANWTFFFWGALFAIIYLIEKAVNTLLHIDIKPSPFSPTHLLLALKTYLIVSFIWVFFRSQSIGESFTLFEHLFSNTSVISEALSFELSSVIFFCLFLISDAWLYNSRFDKKIGSLPIIARWAIYTVLIGAIIIFAGVEEFPFIYFQF